MEPNKKRKIEKLSEYKKGMKIAGVTIEKIYFSNNELEFIIIKGKEDGEIHVFGGNTSKIDHLLAETKFFLSNFKLNEKDKEMFNYQRVIAINACLVGEIETSKEILEKLLKKLFERKVVSKKIWYIGVFFLMMVTMIVLSIQPFLFTNYKLYFKIATFGAVGGFISLNLKLNKVEFQLSEGTVSYVVVSLYKAVFSMLTSVVCYFLIESNLIFGALNSSNANNYFFIYSISALAGFSESLLPNIFNHIEKTYQRGKE